MKGRDFARRMRRWLSAGVGTFASSSKGGRACVDVFCRRVPMGCSVDVECQGWRACMCELGVAEMFSSSYGG